jgi:hypothetical protein
MKRRRAPALLTPLLAAIVLAAFSISGLMTGVLARGFVSSLAAARVTASPAYTPTHIATPTPVPTRAGPDSPFDLQLTALPQRVAAGATVTLKVLATVVGKGLPVAHLVCTLRAPRTGDRSLLTSWPASQETNANGIASWQITVPHLAPGDYRVEVDASGTHNYTAWSFATVYVTG